MSSEIDNPYQAGCDAVHSGADCPYAPESFAAKKWETGFQDELKAWEYYCEQP